MADEAGEAGARGDRVDARVRELGEAASEKACVRKGPAETRPTRETSRDTDPTREREGGRGWERESPGEAGEAGRGRASGRPDSRRVQVSM